MRILRAKDEIRTRDPDLGKVVLYQLSYFRIDFVYIIRCFSRSTWLRIDNLVSVWDCKYKYF
jgi:hypothetical protein